MNSRHQSDLTWRFQHAQTERSFVPSATYVLQRTCELGGFQSGGMPSASVTDAQLETAYRADRVDDILDRLPVKPVPCGRVLRMRYGFYEELVVLKLVLPNLSYVASLSPVAAAWFEKIHEKPARPRSNDVRGLLESICARVSTRTASDHDERVLAQIRVDSEKLLRTAEDAYEALAERYDRRSRTWAA